jgi:RHS repeat-associated protein
MPNSGSSSTNWPRPNQSPAYPVFVKPTMRMALARANEEYRTGEESAYYIFGGERLVSGTVDDPHKFAGMYLDGESGLYYTWFRMYDPTLGRWLAPDPIAGDARDPGSLNRYTYVGNDPVNLNEPPACS